MSCPEGVEFRRCCFTNQGLLCVEAVIPIFRTDYQQLPESGFPDDQILLKLPL